MEKPRSNISNTSHSKTLRLSPNPHTGVKAKIAMQKVKQAKNTLNALMTVKCLKLSLYYICFWDAKG